MKKIKSIILSILVVALNFGVNAQAYEWAKSMGGTNSDSGYSTSIDALGNLYIIGVFQGTVDFDPGAAISNLTSAGSNDIFILKLDAAGNFLWAKNMGGTASDIGLSISIDDLGNIYTTGHFQGTADFDPGAAVSNLTSGGGIDIFISKLDATGDFLWAKSIGGASTDLAEKLTIDASGNIYITGAFQGAVDFDPGVGISNLSSTGGSDCFILKLDVSGNFLWAKNMGGTNNDPGLSIITDISGNVYTTGYFQGTADFDPGVGISNLTSVGNNDMFISKLDVLGDFLWVKSIGGTNNIQGKSLAIDASGNIYLTGSFVGPADFDPSIGTSILTSLGNYDVFILKLDAAGNFLWANNMGGTNIDQGASIHIDTSGFIYITGHFGGTVDFDPGIGISNLTSTGGDDIFILKLDSLDNFLWAKNMGGTSDDQGKSISTDISGNLYLTGSFEGSADFDPDINVSSLTSLGANDIFISKINQCNNTGTDIQTTCNSYTWIDGNTYTVSNNTATHTLTNINGCDSIVQLDLTINSDLVTQTYMTCGNFTWIDGVTYTASNNSATHTLTNINGCDSILMLDLTITIINNNTTLSGITISATETTADNYTWLNCDNNNSIFIPYTFSEIEFPYPGNFAVEITKNGCIDTSACITITDQDFYDLPNYTPLSAEVFALPVTDLDSCNALAFGFGNGGFPPYQFDWYTQANNDYYDVTDSLCEGFHSLKIYDMIGDSTIVDYFVTDSSNWYDWYQNNATFVDTIYLATQNCSIDMNSPIDSSYISSFTYLYSGTGLNEDYYYMEISYFQMGTGYTFGDTVLMELNGVYLIDFSIYCPTKSTSRIKTILTTINYPTILGIHQNTTGESIYLYPNPSNGRYSIDLGALQNVSLDIYNAQGKLIYTERNISQEVYNFELNIENGIYFIEVVSKENRHQLKLIKE